MPYNPQFGTGNKQEDWDPPPPPPAGYKPQFGQSTQHTPDIYDAISSALRLRSLLFNHLFPGGYFNRFNPSAPPDAARQYAQIATQKFLRRAALLGGIIAGFLVLATIAFGSAGMGHFFHGIGHALALLLSPSGIRVIAFTLLVLGIFGAVVWLCLRYETNLICGCMAIAGIAVICIGAYGGHIGLFSGFAATWIGVGGGLTSFIGWIITEGDFFSKPSRAVHAPAPTPVRPPMPTPAPSRDVYGSGRSATPDELHGAWGGKSAGNRGGFDKMFED